MEIASQLSSTFYNLANLINMTEGRRLLDSALKDTAASMMKNHGAPPSPAPPPSPAGSQATPELHTPTVNQIFAFDTAAITEIEKLKRTGKKPKKTPTPKKSPKKTPAKKSPNNIPEPGQVLKKKKETAKRSNTDTEVQHRAKKAKTLQSGDYEKTKEHEKAREQYSKAQEKLSKTQEKLKEILQSGDTEKANALMEDCVKTKKKLEEMIKTMPPEEISLHTFTKTSPKENHNKTKEKLLEILKTPSPEEISVQTASTKSSITKISATPSKISSTATSTSTSTSTTTSTTTSTSTKVCSKLLGQAKGITVVKKSEKEDAEEDSAEKEEEAGAATDAPDNSSSDEKLEDSDVTVVSE